jgi:hypothetical protein
MSSNTVDSPSASDNDSNNPYNVLQDDDEDEVPTDVDQKSEEESDHLCRAESSESEYESATDTTPVGNKSQSKIITYLSETSEYPSTQTSNPKESNRTNSNSGNFSDTEDSPRDFPGAKPRAKATSGLSFDVNNTSVVDPLLQDTSRRLFHNRKHPPSTKTTAEEINPSLLDNLVYEARQYDATRIEATSNTSSMT